MEAIDSDLLYKTPKYIDSYITEGRFHTPSEGRKQRLESPMKP